MTARNDPQRAAVERLLDLVGEQVAREVLAGVARPAVLAEFERVVVRRIAHRLLSAREERPAIRDRLVARGISERTAYRAIDAILGLGPRSSATDVGAVADSPARLDVPNE